MKNRFSNFIWGTFLLLAAAFILFNHLEGFADIGVGSIIVSIIALIFMIQCIASLYFAPLPIPLAILYIAFHTTLGLPDIPKWTLIIAAVLATIGLSILIPRRSRNRFNECGGSKFHNRQAQFQAADTDNDNNPSVSVKFGSVSRRLQASSLETAQLSCNFGELQVYLDQVELSPNGAEINISCNFGSTEIFIQKHWLLVDRLNCSLGGVDVDKSFSTPAENAPKLTLSGNVSFGAVEVHYL